jgi:hypothetical protein
MDVVKCKLCSQTLYTPKELETGLCMECRDENLSKRKGRVSDEDENPEEYELEAEA